MRLPLLAFVISALRITAAPVSPHTPTHSSSTSAADSSTPTGFPSAIPSGFPSALSSGFPGFPGIPTALPSEFPGILPSTPPFEPFANPSSADNGNSPFVSGKVLAGGQIGGRLIGDVGGDMSRRDVVLDMLGYQQNRVRDRCRQQSQSRRRGIDKPYRDGISTEWSLSAVFHFRGPP
ncbi:uncharacterized protein LAESUDRAFT_717214 [Laetiporus sulphureus 93-53]|uniref:Uncharacterized protein n=1 Tax=Laetiporus sulphureus 93-53 TaxID=1314785 RepID=A0A165BY86_9APHY|nr:uncharacterized protein LAESUDRAFT_717214 [Laetiporus sulphureus 93-53]KZT01866.1 hypothetical protein LAESUDRAFT_717214 [Laetiporus sulphureus 93-53]